MRRTWPLAAALVVFMAPIALAASMRDGDRDATFDGDGRALVGFETGSEDFATSVLLQSDGKIVAAGGRGARVAMTRVLPNGALDTSFGNGGRVIGPAITIPVSGSNPPWTSFATGAAQQEDGKLMISAAVEVPNFTRRFGAMRFDSDGTLDNAFGDSGLLVTDIPGVNNEVTVAIAVQPDGKFLLAGFGTVDGKPRFVVTRHTSLGALDPTWGTAGTAGATSTSFPSSDGAIAQAMTLQSDGKVVVSGFTTKGDDKLFAVARYRSNGTLDPTFSDDGRVQTALSARPTNASAAAVVVQPNGRIVAVGRRVVGDLVRIALVRYLPNGNLDLGFDSDGRVETVIKYRPEGRAKRPPIGAKHHSQAFAAAFQADGKIVVAGRVRGGDLRQFVLARYLTDGSLDPTFGSGGIVQTPFPGSTNSFANDIALDPDGPIVAAGVAVREGAGDMAIARYAG